MYRENKEAKASERSENEGGTSVPPHAMNNKGWASLHEINLAVTYSVWKREVLLYGLFQHVGLLLYATLA
jgi:hypothetical protein